MTIDLAIGDRVFRATVTPGDRADDAVRVHLRTDGGEESHQTYHVHETAQGMLLVDEADGRIIDAAVGARPGGEWLVQLRGVDMVVTANGRGRRPAEARGPAGDERVTAPMPGRILRVLVAVGATVEGGQPLVVIEAMKMENVLMAVRGGTVREVAVEEGVSVEAGRLLVRID